MSSPFPEQPEKAHASTPCIGTKYLERGVRGPIPAVRTRAFGLPEILHRQAKDWSRAEKNREMRMKGEGKIPGWFGALFYMAAASKPRQENPAAGFQLAREREKHLGTHVSKAMIDSHSNAFEVLGFMKEILFTIVPQKNITFNGDRVGLTRSSANKREQGEREGTVLAAWVHPFLPCFSCNDILNGRVWGSLGSAMFLFIFIIIHAVGNLHVFLGPDDFNGYGYFYVRLYWTGFGLQANIVEALSPVGFLTHVGFSPPIKA